MAKPKYIIYSLDSREYVGSHLGTFYRENYLQVVSVINIDIEW